MRDRPASAPPSANALVACATGCSGSPCTAPATGPGSPQPAARSNAPPYAESCLAVYDRDSGGHIQATLRQRERGGIRYRFPPADATAVAALPHRRRRNAGREVGSCPLPAVGQHDRITVRPDNAARVTQARQLLRGAGRPERYRRTPIAAEDTEVSQAARDVRQEPAPPTQPRRLACPSPSGTCDRCPAEVFGWAQIVMIRQPLLAMLAGRGVPHGLTHTGLPRSKVQAWLGADGGAARRLPTQAEICVLGLGRAAGRSRTPFIRSDREPPSHAAQHHPASGDSPARALPACSTWNIAQPIRAVPCSTWNTTVQKRQSPANRALLTARQGALSGAAGWPARHRCPSGSSAAR